MWFATECRKCLSEACVSLTHWTNFNQEEAPSFFFRYRTVIVPSTNTGTAFLPLAFFQQSQQEKGN